MSTLVEAERPAPSPWWITPHGLTLGFLIPVLVMVAAAGRLSFRGLTVRGHVFLNDAYVLMAIVILVCIAVGGWIGTKITATLVTPDTSAYMRAGFFVGLIGLLAYLFWFRSFFLSPGLLLQMVLGSYKPDRTEIGSTTGITSLVNMAPVYLSLCTFHWVHDKKRMPVAYRVLAIALVVLTLFRVYAWSERLALIEAALPFAVAIGLKLSMGKATPLKRFALVVGPFAAVPMLILYFGASEYFRSWQSDTYAGKMNFWEFAIGRFASYYFTSLNNGAGVLEMLDWPSFRFENTLMWVHKFPFGVGEGFALFVGQPRVTFDQFLSKYVDLEFNNPSGIFSVVYDLGLPLGIVYFCLIAVAAGHALNLYRRKHPAGALLYPILYLSLLEIYRYPYLGASRAFTWQLGIGIVLVGATLLKSPNRAR